MSGRVVLDTNVVIPLISGDSAVVEKLERTDEVFIAAIVLGELFFGAYRSRNAHANLAQIDSLTAVVPVLVCDAGTSREYGLIKTALRLKGRPIPENDIWIAALARQHSLTLVSRDEHFAEVDGLTRETW